jgi:L-asparaginase II
MTSPTLTPPVLVELTRGGRPESWHRGIVAIMRADGQPLLLLGDTGRTVYPRSATKALQAVPLIESGAAARFGFSEAELALACASHSGTDRHTRVAIRMLKSAGLGSNALACGAHLPVDGAAANAMIRSGRAPTALHNNCSGKHAGMLATATQMGAPIASYIDPGHPVQQAIREVITDFASFEIGPDQWGCDGCSAPNWALPLDRLALAFARFGRSEGRHGPAAQQLMQACWAAPELVAGPGRLDTIFMTALKGRVFMKTGAEGVYVASLPEHALGISVKIDDGAARASEAVIAEIIARLLPDALPLVPPSVLKNWSGREVGERRLGADLARALDGLKL